MEVIIGAILVVLLVMFVVLLIYYFIVDYWPIILGVLAVAFIVWIAVKALKKQRDEMAALASMRREAERKQLSERNDSIQHQIEEHNERISHLREQIDTMNSRSGEIEAFNDLFSALGTSKGKEISETQAAQIQKLESQLAAFEEKVEKLKRELDQNQQRIYTNS